MHSASIELYSLICTALGQPFSNKQKRESRSWSCQARLFRAEPCILSLALLFILLALLYLLFWNFDYDTIGFDDDSLIFYNGSESWPTRWIVTTEPLNFGAPHAVDMYFVPASGVKIYEQLQTYHGNETFYASSTRLAVNFNGVYLNQGSIFQFNVTASSGKQTTTNGHLVVFQSNPLYHEYIRGELPDNPLYNDFVPFNYSIGADNIPLKTNISVRINATSYYYIACTVPANSTFSVSASYYALRYNYSINNTKMVTVDIPDAAGSKAFYFPEMKELMVLLAHIQPNITYGHSSVHIFVEYHRLLPSYLLLILFGVAAIFVLLSAILLFGNNNISLK